MQSSWSETGPTGPVWRVGFRPNPWEWTPWAYAGSDGRYTGRWDDAAGEFRVLYAGSSILGCLLEVLAPLRPDAVLTADADFADIVDNDGSEGSFPTVSAGTVSRDWVSVRAVGRATLRGAFYAVTNARSIAIIRRDFRVEARAAGVDDVDASVLKNADVRSLTQAIATDLQQHTRFAGISYASRFGDDEHLWAVFEREGEAAVSPHLSDLEDYPAENWDLAIGDAFEVFGLKWQAVPVAPDPVTVAHPDELRRARFPPDGEASPDTPLGSADLWVDALVRRPEYLRALKTLTCDPLAWGDFRWAEDLIGNCSMKSNVLYPADGSLDVAYVSFVPGQAESTQAFGHYELPVEAILIMRRDEGIWRAWGLGGALVGPAEVRAARRRTSRWPFARVRRQSDR